jgi:phosphatidylglycerophosphate synthase
MPETAETPSDSETEKRLEAWSRSNAALLVAGSGIAAYAKSVLPLAAVAAISFLVLLAHERRRFSDAGRAGAANWITLLRLGLVLGLASRHRSFSLLACASLAALVLVLDGVDGFVARRAGAATAFGARFDMETDALFVLTLGFVLWTRERLGPWALLGGVLRPGYVLWLWALPAAGEEPRSLWGRLAFLAFALGLIAPLASYAAWADAFAVCGTVAVALSFARSGRHWFRSRAALRSAAHAKRG